MLTAQPVIAALNAVLTNELTAINQYFLHARMLKHMGLMQLADHEYKKSIDQMKHTDMLVERVLALGGLPNMQSLGSLSIGSSASEIIQCDITLANNSRAALAEAITTCETANDAVSRDMLQRILVSGAEHHEFLSTQAHLSKG